LKLISYVPLFAPGTAPIERTLRKASITDWSYSVLPDVLTTRTAEIEPSDAR